MGLEELQSVWNARADKYNQWNELGVDEIVAFAQEIEREACAKTCESFIGNLLYENMQAHNDMAEACAKAIRERSNVKVTGSAPTALQGGKEA